MEFEKVYKTGSILTFLYLSTISHFTYSLMPATTASTPINKNTETSNRSEIEQPKNEMIAAYCTIA